MIIMVDCDGTLYNGGFNWVAKKNFPWWLIYFGLRFINPKPKKEFIEILNILHENHSIKIVSARSKELEEYTKKSLKRNNALFYEDVKCLGPGPDIAQRKKQEAILIKADIVIDDDDNVIMECFKENIPAYFPDCFNFSFSDKCGF